MTLTVSTIIAIFVLICVWVKAKHQQLQSTLNYRVRDKYSNKSLNSFSDDEMFDILSKNNSIPVDELACICSEVLRRQMIKDRLPSSVNE